MNQGEEAQQVRLVDVRSELDAALIQLRGIEDAEIDVASTEDRLGAALRHVYAAMAGNDDFRTFRDETALATDEVRSALAHIMATPSDDPSAVRVCAGVAKSLGDLQRIGWVMLDTWLPRADRPVFAKASLGFPRLLELAREVVDPGIPLRERGPSLAPAADEIEVLDAPPRTLAEVLALAEETRKKMEAFDAAQEEDAPPEDLPPELPPAVLDDEAVIARFGVPITTHELLVERARDCMDDLSMLGRMRRCTDPEPWASGADTEARMLTKVDAIAACGAGAFSEVVRLLDDRPVPDPELTFGNLFFFGSLAGDDAFDQILRLIEVVELDDPQMLTMVTDALVLAPQPRVDQILPRWVRHPLAARRALAVEVLRRRRTLTVELFEIAGGDADERVLASAARSIPTLPVAAPPGALSWFLQRPSEVVVRAALESAMRLRRTVGYERAVNLVAEGRGSFADAILFVAIAGDVGARPIIEHEMASSSSPQALRAAGWFGEAGAVPFLLGRLEKGEPEIQAAALEALERITGASIVDASIVPEYALEDAPFTRPPRSYEPPGLLDGTFEAWADWWTAWGSGTIDGVRYRWGHRWRLADTLHELTVEDFLQRDRPWASMELSARGGAPPHLDWNDWILQQRRAVDELRRAVHSRATVDGWPSLVAGGGR